MLPQSPTFQLVQCDHHHDVTVLYRLSPRINHLLWYNSTPSGLQKVQCILEKQADTLATRSRRRVGVQKGKVLTWSTTRAREHAKGWFCELFLQQLSFWDVLKISQTSVSAPANVDSDIPQTEPHAMSSKSPQTAPTASVYTDGSPAPL